MARDTVPFHGKLSEEVVTYHVERGRTLMRENGQAFVALLAEHFRQQRTEEGGKKSPIVTLSSSTTETPSMEVAIDAFYPMVDKECVAAAGRMNGPASAAVNDATVELDDNDSDDDSVSEISARGPWTKVKIDDFRSHERSVHSSPVKSSADSYIPDELMEDMEDEDQDMESASQLSELSTVQESDATIENHESGASTSDQLPAGVSITIARHDQYSARNSHGESASANTSVILQRNTQEVARMYEEEQNQKQILVEESEALSPTGLRVQYQLAPTSCESTPEREQATRKTSPARTRSSLEKQIAMPAQIPPSSLPPAVQQHGRSEIELWLDATSPLHARPLSPPQTNRSIGFERTPTIRDLGLEPNPEPRMVVDLTMVDDDGGHEVIDLTMYD